MMTNENWRILEQAFAKAIELDGDARTRMLDEFGETHPTLVQQLLDLLAADDGANDVLLSPVAVAVDQLQADSVDPWIGRQIGPWKIIRRLAEGGMGAVFIAHRADEQYDQTVAIKVMASQLIAKDAVARFRAERQILASLNHPNIATLIDGGSSDEQLPYLVMEYIDGMPIDNYCDTHRLNIKQRLQLFVTICDAVDFAHRNLVIHRDLKPSNILVQSNGEPKLLDFGIAKLLDAQPQSHTVAVTQLGARLMTPEYASPEQVRGEPAAVASDVYALGVLLYRLLTGHSPYERSLVSPGEVEAAIVNSDPKRPSAIVTAPVTVGEQTISAVATGEQRASSPKRLRKLLLGDLDTIVLKALQKEPARRYPGADSLAADILRYMRREPILARPNSWRYVGKKFIQRNTHALAIATGVLLTLGGLAGYYTWQLAIERDRATLSAAKAREVSSFLTQMFASASPFESDGAPPSSIDLLDLAVQRIDSLSDQPALQASLYQVIGDSYSGLADYTQAIELLERAVALREVNNDEDLTELASALGSLATTQRIADQFEPALDNIQRAIELRKQTVGEKHSTVARDLAVLASVYNGLYRDEEALATFEQALAIQREVSPEDDAVTLEILGGRTVALSHLGRIEEAAEAGVELIALTRKLGGEADPNLAIRLNNLTLNYLNLGEYDQAYVTSLEAVRVARIAWPDGHPQLLKVLETHVPTLLFQSRFDEQDLVLDEIDAIIVANEGKDSLSYASARYSRAQSLEYQLRSAEAAALYREALETAIALQGPDEKPVGMYSIYAGRALVRTGDEAAGERLLRRGLALASSIGRGHLLNGKQALVKLLSKKGEYDEADTLLAEVLEAREKSAGENRAPLFYVYVIAADHLRRKDDLAGSLRFSQQAYDIARTDYAPGDRNAAWGIIAHARTLRALGRREDAQPLLREGYDSIASAYGAENSRVREIADLL
ncbi:MAG: serine/threonine-protein kinase [Pseudomonadota bacterium]